ncbi:hypothetical protein CRUP_014903, partial [Coryphaenoides rupestris]
MDYVCVVVSHLRSLAGLKVSRMLSVQADQVESLAEWEQRWQDNRIGFHRAHVNKLLEKNIDKVVAGRTAVRFFFPLCGKAVDMKWLADMGHTVVGVEIAEKAILQFYEENDMSHVVETVPSIPGAKVYKSSIMYANRSCDKPGWRGTTAITPPRTRARTLQQQQQQQQQHP